MRSHQKLQPIKTEDNKNCRTVEWNPTFVQRAAREAAINLSVGKLLLTAITIHGRPRHYNCTPVLPAAPSANNGTRNIFICNLFLVVHNVYLPRFSIRPQLLSINFVLGFHFALFEVLVKACCQLKGGAAAAELILPAAAAVAFSSYPNRKGRRRKTETY